MKRLLFCVQPLSTVILLLIVVTSRSAAAQAFLESSTTVDGAQESPSIDVTGVATWPNDPPRNFLLAGLATVVSDSRFTAQATVEADGTDSNNSEINSPASDPAIAPELTSEQFSRWWLLWLLGLPLLVLVIWWVVAQEKSKAVDTGAEEPGSIAITATTGRRSPLGALAASEGDKADFSRDASAPILPSAALSTMQPTTEGFAAQPFNPSALLPPLPSSKLVLVPADGQMIWIRWEVAAETMAAFRQQGGERFVLQVYDVTDIDPRTERPHTVQQFDCDETATQLQVAVPMVNRCYLADLGYITNNGQWLRLAHSLPVEVFGQSMTRSNGQTIVAPVDLGVDSISNPPIPNVNGPTLVEFPVGSASDSETADLVTTAPQAQLSIGVYGSNAVSVQWDIPEAIAIHIQQQGIQTLLLRLHDVTWIDLDCSPAHHTEMMECDIEERDRIVPVWATDRDYLVELGYTNSKGQWIMLRRSSHIHVASA